MKKTINELRQNLSTVYSKYIRNVALFTLIMFTFVGANVANAAALMTFDELVGFIKSTGSGTSGLIWGNLNATYDIGAVERSGLTVYGANPITITGNNNSGFTVGSGITFTMQQLIMHNFLADNGSALYIYGGTVNLTGTNTFSNNVATSKGGAIYNNGTIASGITGATFTCNSVKSVSDSTLGGAIFNGGTITNGISNTTFVGNYTSSDTATSQGGAIYNNATTTIKDSTFSWNGYSDYNSEAVGDVKASIAVTKEGGAIYNGSKINFTGTNTFSNNVATNVGGAISTDNILNFTGENTTFSNNSVKNSDGWAFGGAIYNEGELNLTGTNTFTGNFAIGSSGAQGGAIFNGGELNLTGDNTFTGNYTQVGDGEKVANDIYNEGDLNINSGTTNMDGGISGDGALTVGNGTDAAHLNLVYNGKNANLEQDDLTVNSNAKLTINASNLNVTGTVSNEGTIDLTGGTLQKDITGSASSAIIISGDVTGNADFFSGVITNNASNLILRNGILDATIKGAGTTIIDEGNVSATYSIENSIIIKAEKGLIIEADRILGDVDNSGIITISHGLGTLSKKITGSGKIELNGDITTSANNLGNIVENRSSHYLTLTGGQLVKAITGTAGYVVIYNDVIANASIENAITVNSGKNLTISADNVDGIITNNGIVNLNAGTLEKAINGGAINILGDVITSADNLQGTIANPDFNLTLTGGTLSNVITGADGTTTIDGTVTSDVKINNLITINTDKSLTIGAANIGNDVDNSGTLNIGAGTLSYAITGEGTIVTEGDITTSADNLGNTVTNSHIITLTEGTLTKSISGTGVSGYNGAVDISGNVIANASINCDSLGVDSSGILTINADNIDSYVGNTGIVNLTGGTLEQEINGLDGNIVILGNVTSDVTYLHNNITNTSSNLTLTSNKSDKYLTYEISGDGTTTIDGTITALEAINNAIIINPEKSLTIYADRINGAVTNSGTLNIDNGILSKPITGSGNIVTEGDITTSADNIGNPVSNNYELHLTGGTLTKSITGDGIVDISHNETVQVAQGVSFGDSTLNFNDSTLDLRNNAIETTTINKLSGSNNAYFDLDFDGNATGNKIDQIQISSLDTTTPNVSVAAIRILNDTDTEDTYTWMTGSSLPADSTSTVVASTSAHTYTFTKDSDGVLSLSLTSGATLPQVVHDSAYETVTSYSIIETTYNLNDNLGDLYGTERSLTIFGNGNTIDAQDKNTSTTYYSGVAVGGAVGEQTLKIDNATMKNFKSTNLNGGVVGSFDGAHVELTNTNFESNSVTEGNGGAVYNYGSANISVITGNFSYNTASGAYGGSYGGGGGAIFNRGTIGDITGNFSNNTASGLSDTYANGGAIYNGHIIGDISGDFTYNSATTSGGAIYSIGVGIDSITGDFTNNSATTGGAIYNSVEIHLISDSSFSNNTVSESGGAIKNEAGTITLSDTDFESNSAESGGAISNDVGATLNLSETEFSKNSATIIGGAVYNNATLNITGTNKFSENTATTNGGAIYNAKDATLNITGTNTFSKNSAASGGAIYNETDKSAVINASFTENYASEKGGAIAVTPFGIGFGGITIEGVNGNFTGNYVDSSATAQGGAIYNAGATGMQKRAATINSLTGTFSGNYAKGTTAQGGAIYSGAISKVTLNNATLKNNYAQGETAQGGAIYNIGTLNLTGDNTFTGNYTTTDGTTKTDSDITNEGTLNINSGTTNMDGGIIGDGSTTIANGATLNLVYNNKNADLDQANLTNEGTLIVDADELKIDNTISNSGTINLKDGTNENSISGDGSLYIDGTVTQTSGKTVSNAVIINNAKTLNASISDLTGTVENNGTFNMTGDLEKNITGLGTTILQSSDVDVVDGTTISGTLDMNSKNVNIRDNTDSYQTLTVGSLKGTGNLSIDLDVTNNSGVAAANDKISIANGSSNSATLNLNSINVVNATVDYTKGTYNNFVEYVIGETSGITYQLNGATGSTATYKYTKEDVSDGRLYIFTLGNAGKLNMQVKDAEMSLTEFITNANGKGGAVNTYSIDTDYSQTGVIGTTAIRDDSTKELSVFLNNGSDLIETSATPTNKGFTVADGFTLNLTGSTKDEHNSTVSNFSQALIVNNGGTANVSDLTFKDNKITSSGVAQGCAICNEGTLNLTGTNTFTGNYTQVGGGDKVVNDIYNSGTLKINSGETSMAGGITGIGSTTVGNGTDDTVLSLGTGAVLNQSSLTTNAKGTITATDASITTGNLVNNGTINLGGTSTGSSLTVTSQTSVMGGIINSLAGTQTLKVKSNTTDDISSQININSGSTLKFIGGTITADAKISLDTGATLNISNSDDANSYVNIGAGDTWNGTINDDGRLFITGKATCTSSDAKLVIKSGRTVNMTSANNIVATVENSGNLYLNSGTLSKSITGDGKTEFVGNVTLDDNASVTTNIVTQHASASLTAKANQLGTKDIKNDGRITITEGNLANNINKGTDNPDAIMNIAGTVTNNDNKTIDQILLIINSDCKFSTNADFLTLTNGITNGGTLEFTGGTNNNVVGGSAGVLKISGATSNAAAVTQKSITIDSEKTFTSSAAIIADTVDNNGVLQLNLGGSATIATMTQDGGRTVVNSGATFSVAGGEFKNTSSTGNGGAIYNAGTITQLGKAVKKATFTDNSAVGDNFNGGAIANSGGEIGDIYADFTNNYAKGTTNGMNSGGAIYNSDSAEIGSITGDFKGNYAESSATTNYVIGGAISNRTGSTIKEISNSSFTNNGVKGSSNNVLGGAIFNEGTITNGISNTTFKGNYAQTSNTISQGGAIWNGSTIAISASTFEWNGYSDYNSEAVGDVKASTAVTKEGGAIYNKSGATLNFSGTNTFSNNSAESGGAISNDANATLNITGTNTFSKNSAKSSDVFFYGNGGAISNNGALSITGAGTSFSENSAILGGAIYTGSSVTSINADFTGNYATNAGGAIAISPSFLASSDITVTTINGKFTGNHTDSLGGAIYSAGGGGLSAGKVTISNLSGILKGNYTTGTTSQGGAIYNGSNSTITLNGTTFEWNGYSDYNSEAVGDVKASTAVTKEGGAIYNTGTLNFTGTNTFSNNAILVNSQTVANDIYNTGTINVNSGTTTLNGGIIQDGGRTVVNSGATFSVADGEFKNTTITSADSVYGAAIYNNGTITKINAVFTDNKTESDNQACGGAIFNDANCTIGDITGNFTRNSAISDYEAQGGAILNNTQAEIGYITGDFKYNSVSGGAVRGGAILNINGAKISGIKGDFEYNEAKSTNTYSDGGGAIANTYHAEIGDIKGNFNRNKATADNLAKGGAIYNYDHTSTGNIKGNFTYNSISSTNAAADGGAIYNYVNIEMGNIEGNFENNSAQGLTYVCGGAIYNSYTSSIGDIKGNFISNSATSTEEYAKGGAIFNNGTSEIGDITGDFKYNSAVSNATASNKCIAQGGAIYNDHSEITSLTSDFTGNFVKASLGTAQGGAIYNVGEELTITSTEDHSVILFTGNYATGTTSQGGAIYNAGTVSLSGTKFEWNGYSDYSESATPKASTVATKLGGAIYNASGATISFTGTNIFSRNSATTNGGAIYNEGTITSLSADFNYNAVSYCGGAVINLADNTPTNSSVISNISGDFKSNSAEQGGAIYNGANAAGKTATIENITNAEFTANQATYLGGAIYNSGAHGGTAEITITNASFSNNTAETNGGAIYNYQLNGGTTVLTLKNVTFTNNTANSKLNDIANTGTVNIYGNVSMTGGITGAGLTTVGNGTDDISLNLVYNDQTADLAQKDLTVNEKGTLTVGASELKVTNTIQNAGTINLVSGTLESEISGGSTVIEVDNEVNSSATNLKTNVTNNGILNLNVKDQVLTGKIKSGTGTTNITNDLTVGDAAELVAGDSVNKISISQNKTLSITGDNVSVTLDGGTNYDRINWAGDVILNNSTATLTLNHICSEAGGLNPQNKTGTLHAYLGILWMNVETVSLTTDDVIAEAVEVHLTGETKILPGADVTVDSSDEWKNSTVSLEGGTLHLDGVTTSSTDANKLDAQTGTLEIKNEVTLGNGDSIEQEVATTIVDGANLKLTNSTVTLDGDTDTWTGTVTTAGGNLTIDNITTKTGAFIQTSGTTEIINGFTLNNANDNISGGEIDVTSGDLNVSNGTIGSDAKLSVSSGDMNISGGAVNYGGSNDSVSGKISQTGGTLNIVDSTSTKLNVTGGSLNIQNANTKLTIGDGSSTTTVSKIITGDTSASINIVEGTTLELKKGGSVILDNSVSTKVTWDGNVAINEGGELTMNGITKETSATSIYNQNLGTLNLQNTTLTLNSGSKIINATITMDPSTIIFANGEQNSAAIVINDTEENKIIIDGTDTTLSLQGNTSITGNSKVTNSGTLNSSGEMVKVAVTNNGTYNLSEGTIAENNDIKGTGTLNITGSKETTNNAKIEQNAVNVWLGASIGGTGSLELGDGTTDCISENKGSIAQTSITNNAKSTLKTDSTKISVTDANGIKNAGIIEITKGNELNTKVTGIDASTSGVVQINNNEQIKLNADLTNNTLMLAATAQNVVISNPGTNLQNANIEMGAGTSGIIDIHNGVIDEIKTQKLTLNSSTGAISMDTNLTDKTIDTVFITAFDGNNNKLIINTNMPSSTRLVLKESQFSFSPISQDITDATLKGNLAKALDVKMPGTVTSPIYLYKTAYNSNTGEITLTRSGYNSSIYAASVGAQVGVFLVQNEIYQQALANMDQTMLMTREERAAMKFANKISSTETQPMVYAPNQIPEQAKGLWFRPFANFEKVGLSHGPKVENIAYGSLFGGDSNIVELKHGWDMIWGGYAGYIGSHQNYDGTSIYQNGGTLGFNAFFYKGNFFAGLTANVGASVAEASTSLGSEDFTSLMTGVAVKTGYNWELFKSRLIIQPSLLLAYTFVNTFDYTNAAGVRITSDPLNALQIVPGIKFIANLKHGWQPYLSVQMIWNTMDNTHFYANNAALPQMSVDPYVQYGIGVQKRWGDRFTGYFQTMLRNGGRNGVALSAGFRWVLGKSKKDKVSSQKAKVIKCKKDATCYPAFLNTIIRNVAVI